MAAPGPRSRGPFSRRVTETAWLDEVTAWVHEQARDHGHAVVGRVEQTRVRPWSTQLLVPTDAGRWWFKAGCRSMAFEAGLHGVLADLAGHRVAAPLAVDTDRGWLLTPDQGSTLQERSGEPTIDDWCRVVVAVADVQAATASQRRRLLATGLPDCAPSTTVDRFDRLLTIYADLPQDHPTHVPPALAARLRAVRPRLVDAVAQLEQSPLPPAWQHGDLHPGNAFVAGDGVHLFDFGDSQWAHPLEALVVPFGVVTTLSGVDWEPVLAAYADAWQLEVDVVREDWPAVLLTHAVNRSLTWWGCLAEGTAGDWDAWGEAPRVHLTEVLAP